MNYNLVYKKVHFISYKNILILFLFFNLSFLYAQDCVDIIPPGSSSAYIPELNITFSISGAAGDSTSDALLNSIAIAGHPNPYAEVWPANSVSYNFANPAAANQYVLNNTVLGANISQGAVIFDPDLLGTYSRNLRNYVALDNAITVGDYIDYSFNVPFLSAVNRYIVITDADGDHASQIQALDASGNPMAMSATTIPGVTYIDSGYLTDNGENIFITVFPITALANSGTPIHGLRYNPLDTAGDGPNGKVFVMYDVNTQVCIEAQDDVITSTLIVPGGTTPSIYEDHGNGIDNVNDVIASPFSISTNIDIIDNGGLTGATINNSGVITIPPNTSPGLYLLEYEICLGFYSSVCDQATAIILVQLDTDSDGIPDADDGFTGGNGISVSTDIDDDNDGITDFEEMKCNQVNLGNSNNGLTGAYRDNIFWLNWTGDFANGIHVGDSQTFTLPDGATITATVTNAVATNGATSDYVPVDMNTEASSLLKDYYNSPGTSEAFYNSAVDGVDLDVTFEFTATYNGLTYLPDLVLADAENTNPYMPNLESLIFTTNGRVWEELDHIPKADTQNSNNVISTSTEGITAAGNGYYVYRSKDATRIEVSSQTVTNKQGFAIGIWLECLPLDFDGDNYPNHLDLDSDGDGIYDIVEAGNGAHDIDVPFHNYASDKDGRTDSNVGSNGLDNGLETNDSYYNAVINYVLPNTDGNGGYNYLDIDSDNDGIVDNIEGQPSNAYVAPSTNDNNHNGVDDAYDNAFTWIDPENTDGADLPDYMDTNADNDDHTDAIEGWDTTNDGIANTNPSGNDTDGDGLDDNYDNDNTQINPTNGQTPASFPNLDNHLTPELDWREVVVTTISVEKTGIWNDVNSDGLADAGETVLYTIEIENTGNSPLFNFQFADPGVTVITGLPIPNLIAGATHTVLVRQTITQAAVDAGEISNQATVTYTAPTITNVTPLGYVYTNDSDDPNDNTDNDNADTDPEDDPDDITIIDLPQDSSMNVEKTDVSNDVNSNGQMDPGDTITYTIVITNTSNTTLNGITITDPLLGVVNQPIGSGSIAPNSSETVTLVYTLVQADIDNGIVTNQATVNYVDYSGTTYTNGSDDPDDNTDNDNADTETDADPDDPTPTDIIQVNNISVIKTDTYDDANSNGLADPGETINYVITITNTGNTTLTNVVIDDALLAMANVQVGSGTLSAGQVVVINGSYTLLQADIDSGTVTNQATVTYTDIDGVISTNDSDDPDENADVDSNDTEPNTDPDDPTVTDIIQDNSISVIKTDAVVDVDTNGLINIGDRIDYTIQITNIGNTTINNVTITDSLLGITNQQVGTGTLISGAVETVTGSYILTQADVDSGSVSNQALVNYTDNDGNSFTNASDDPDELANLDNSDTEPNNDPDDPTVTEIIKDNSITVTKTDTYVDTNTNGFIDVGDTINYTIIVTHTGNVTLSLVLVTDVLVGVNNELINIGGIILPEDVETINYSYIITQADINTGQVSNQATIRYDDVDAIRLTNDSDDPDDNSDNDNADTETNNDPDDPTITDIPQINLLTVTKTDAYVDTNFNGVLDSGDTIEYTIIVTNTGNVPLTNVSLDDALVGIINQQVGTGTLNPTDSETITLSYTLVQADIDAETLSNQATITYTDFDGNVLTNDSDDPDDNSENDNTDTEPNTDPDDPTVTDIIRIDALSVIKTDVFNDVNSNGFIDVGETIDYTIVVSNTGNMTQTNISITDALLNITNQVVGTGILAPNTSETLNYTYTLTQTDIDAGEVSNQATVTYTDSDTNIQTNDSDDPDDNSENDNADSEPANDADDPTVTDIPHNDRITVTKTDSYNDVNANGVMDSGDTIDYIIIVTNIGNTTLTNVTLTDTLLAINNQAVGTGTMIPSDTETITGTYTLLQVDIDAGSVSNQATISFTDPNNNSYTNDSDDPDDINENDNADTEEHNDQDDPTVTDIIQNNTMTVTKTDNYVDTNSNGVMDIGDHIGYTIIVSNIGNTTLSNVTITDTLLGVNNQQVGTGTLLPTAVETLNYNYPITQADIDAGQISNQATISYSNPNGTSFTNDSDDPDDSSEIDNTDSEPNSDPDDPTVTDIIQIDSITVIKTDNYIDTDSNGLISIDDTLTYTITITNTGNTTLSGVTLTDALLSINNQLISNALAPNNVETNTYNYTLIQADIDAGTVSNQAVISYTDPENNTYTNDSDDPDDASEIDNTDSEPNADPDDPTVTDIPHTDQITVIKTDNYVDTNLNGIMDAGDTIEYTITITNIGNTTLSNIEITDPLLGINNQQVGTGVILPNLTETLNYNYTITQADVDAENVSNQATVSYTNLDGNAFTNDSDDPDDNADNDNTDTEPNTDPDDPTDTEIIRIDALSIVKTDTYVDVNTNGLMDAGDRIDYTIIITNVGSSTLTNISITDALVNVTNQQVGTGIFEPEDTETLNYNYTLLQTDIDAGLVNNQATVTYTDPNNNTYTNDSDDPDDITNIDNTDTEPNDDFDDPTVTDIIQIDRITVVKTDTYVDVNANGLMDVGDQINYAIVVTNTGNTTLTSVSITDALVTVNNQQVGTGTLVPNAIENLNYTYTLLQADIDSGSVSNQATISYSDPNNNTYTNDSDDPDDNTENDTNDTEEFNDADDPTVTDIIHVDRMTVEKTGVWIDANINTLANVGEIVQYQIVIINTGNTTLTGIQFTDSDVVVISGLPILDLAPTNTQTVVVEQPITQQDIDNGSISNQATITYGTPLNGSFTNLSDDPTDNTDNDAADTEIYNDADDITVIQLPVIDQITVTKTGSWVDGNNSGFAEIGETVIYQIILENIGTTTLSNIQFTDANVSVVFGLPIPDLSPSNTHMLIVEQAINQTDIDNSFASNQATITYNNPIGGVFTNNSDDPTNLADVDNADTEPHNDADDITIVPLDINSQMTVTKTGVWNDADADGFADAGEIVQYEIIITNIGATTLSNVQFTDTNVTVISGLPIADLASGDVRTVIVEHVLTQQDVNNAITSNQAIITYDTPFGNTFTNASDDPSDNADIDNADTENHNDADDITVIQLDVNSQMTVEKTGAWNDADADGFAEVGEIVSYQVVIENVGTTTLSNVQFADANVTVISGLPLTDLAPTDTQTVVVEHILTQQDIDNGFTTNQAIITYDTPFGNTFTNASDDPSDNADIDNADTENHNDADDITVIQLDVNSQMTVEKTGAWNDADADGFAEVGEIVSYQVVIENVGTTTLSNVQFADANVTVISGLPLTDLAPTDTQTVVVEQVLTQQDIDNGFATNQATITYDTPFGNTFTNASDDPTNLANIDINNDNEPNHDADDVTVIYLPTNSQMTVLKTGVWNDGNANGNADAGEIVQYQIVIENIGTTTLSDIQFADINVTVVSGLPIVDLAPTDMQTVIVDYVLTQQDVDNGFATNQAIITYNTPSNDTYTNASDDPNNASDIDNHDNEPNHDADDVTVVPLLDVSSQMTVIKTGNVVDGNANGIADLGEIIAYQIVITNTGTTTLTNILFDDANANVSNMPIPNLIPGADNSFTVYHILTQVDIDAGFVTNQATVTYQTPSGNTFTNDSDDPTDNTDADTNDSEPDNDPDDPTIVNLSLTSHMTVEKTGTWIDSNTNGLANVGEVILYQIVIKNTSSTTLSNIQFSDANVNIVFGLPIPDLAYNDNHTVVVQHVLTQADIDTGVYNNQATITYQTPNGNTFTNDSDDPTNFADVDNNDSEPDNDPDDITVVDLPIDNKMNVLKTGNLVDANGNGYSDVGEVIQYEIEIINTGNTTLSNLVFTDNGVTIVSGGTIPSLLPTESHIVVVEQLITQQNIDLGAVSNQALVAYDTPLDGSFTNASDDPNNATDLDINDSEPHNDPDDITVIALPINHQLEVLKTGSLIDADGSGHADIGEMVQYQIEITNTGNTTLSNMQFTDAGVTVVSGLPIPDLPSGATHTVIVEEAVGQLDIDAGFVTNQATITYFTPLSGPFTNDSDDPNDPTDVDGNDTEIRDDPDDITIVRLPTDNDSDGVEDSIDLDDDNDGIPDAVEIGNDPSNPIDSDGDTIPDYLDLDSDNDGVYDIDEAGNGQNDANNDGMTDFPVGNNGLDNNLETDDNPSATHNYIVLDSDLDGILNYLDLDSDNDGMTDTNETLGTDLDGDGLVDNFTDANENGVDDYTESNPISVNDTDGDNLPNFLDIDSDGDGIVDNTEFYPTENFTLPTYNDGNSNGLDNAYDPNSGGTLIIPVDTDGDEIPDYLDLDSDNDDLIDSIEGWDYNADAIPDTVPSNVDADNDGLDDAYDTDTNYPESTNGKDAYDYPNMQNPTTEERDWRESLEIIVYEVFTPNNDGKNDAWHIEGIGYFPNHNVSVYNRWGALVYETNNFDNVVGWSGVANVNGRQGANVILPTGTYFYIIKLGPSYEDRMGYIHIIKED